MMGYGEIIAYHIGEPFVAQYTNAPLPKEQQYSVGQVVDIHHEDRLYAKYRVTETDSANVCGVIVEVSPIAQY